MILHLIFIMNECDGVQMLEVKFVAFGNVMNKLCISKITWFKVAFVVLDSLW